MTWKKCNKKVVLIKKTHREEIQLKMKKELFEKATRKKIKLKLKISFWHIIWFRVAVEKFFDTPEVLNAIQFLSRDHKNYSGKGFMMDLIV